MSESAESPIIGGGPMSQEKNTITSKDVSLVTALNPKVLEAAQKTITEAKARNLEVGIHSGLRTASEQDKLYAQGRTQPGQIVTNAQAYESWHCLGCAVDLVFKIDGIWNWNVPFVEWAQLGKIGKMYGFEWGGDWIKLKDLPHFQMRGKLNIKEAKALLFEKGIEAVWKEL